MGPGATSVVQVSNLAPTATNEQIRTLFTHVGLLREFFVYPTSDPSQQTPKICYVRFTDPINVCVAQHLTNTVFMDRAIMVKPVNDNRIPDEATALKMANEGHLQNSSNSGLVSQIETVNGVKSITTIDPRLNALGLPQYPPLSPSLGPTKIEEIRRTVSVSNVSKQTTPEELLTFCNQFGEVKYLRMTTDENDVIKSALIEYTDQSSVANALQNHLVLFQGSQVNIVHATTSILKPQFKINVEPEKISSSRDRRRSRSRSYRRSRSPTSRRRRSRSPRARSRERRHSRSGSRSPRYRRSTHSRERIRSPYRRRSRDRSYSKERHSSRRDRSKERDRRSRVSRDRSPERSYDRDRDRRRRIRSPEKEYDRYRSRDKLYRSRRSRSRELERKVESRHSSRSSRHRIPEHHEEHRSRSPTSPIIPMKLRKMSPDHHRAKIGTPSVDRMDIDPLDDKLSNMLEETASDDLSIPSPRSPSKSPLIEKHHILTPPRHPIKLAKDDDDDDDDDEFVDSDDEKY